ncbi:hypothetical protein ACIQUB_09670 [Rhizobium sp. NPDC090275]|uniref:hypothetical protein n=1 Tax=Rhizobium sp. NPDC090275 TaxID=3364498 RepID=UPI00383B225C
MSNGIHFLVGDGFVEPDSDIEIKIDFIEDGSSARVFEIAAELIRAFEDLDSVLITSVDSSMATSLVLEDVQKSSLKIFLRNVLKQADDDALKTLDWKPLVGQYLVKAKYVALKWLDKDVADGQPAGIEDLTEHIRELASKTDVRHLPDYPSLNPSRLAQSLDEVQRTKAKFKEGEALTITLDSTDYKVNLERTWLPSEHLQDVDADRELSNIVDMVLVIRKPDLLGKSQWQFKHGKRAFSAPISDKEWLDEFHKGNHPLSPHDALRVRVKHTAKYDEKGNLSEQTEEIVKVLEVIKHQDPPTLI